MSDENVKPVIFVAFANDQDDRVNYLRNLPEEARKIREPIQRARRDELCDFVELANATAADIFRVFQDPEYRDRIAIFHYGGHANGYQLLLESSEGQTAAADAGGLADFLGNQNGLQLVFLNGCSTQNQVDGLLKSDVASVIATSRAIDDTVAMHFAAQFYQGLAGGASIWTAYNEAVASIKTAKGDNTRSLYFASKEQRVNADVDRHPWDLYVRDGAETVADWSLPLAAGDPLFGLPPLPDVDLPEHPYRHLNWFDAEHADVFFGRGHQIRDMYDMLTRPDSTPIVLLYGQSGVGKSLMLAAGIIPRLQDTHEVCYVRRNQDLGLLGSVKQALTKAEVESVGEASIHFAEDWDDVEQDSSKPLLLIVDQIEECFTRPNPELPQDLDEFLNEVAAILGRGAARPQGRLVLGFRKEWLAEIELRLQERRLPRTKVFLERLGRLGIIEAVEGPTSSERLVNQYGLAVEPGLAEMIADDLLGDQGSAIAPTLQILLTKMWHKAIEADQANPVFDQELYLRLKKQGILLDDFLNQQIEALRQWQPDVVDSGLVLDMLTLHTTQLGTAAKQDAESLPQSYAHCADIIEPLVQKCKDLYLLVDPSENQQSDEKGTRLSHDTLAPLIRAMFDESDKPGQRARRILDNRTVDWYDDREGAPLDPVDLDIVEKGKAGSRAFNPTELRLLEASRIERKKRMFAQHLFKIAVGVFIAIVVLGAILHYFLMVGAKNDKIEFASSIVDDYFSTVSEEDLLNQASGKKLRLHLLEKSEEFYQGLSEEKVNDAEMLKEIAVANYNLGLIEFARGDVEAASDRFVKAEGVQNPLYNNSLTQDGKLTDPKLALEYSNTLNELGRVKKDVKFYNDSHAIRQKLAANVEDSNSLWAEYQRKLANVLMNIANFGELDFESDSVLSECNARENGLNQANKIRFETIVFLDNSDLEYDGAREDLTGLRRDLGKGYASLKILYQSMRDNLELDDDKYDELTDKLISNCKLAIKEFEWVLNEQSNDWEIRQRLAECLGPYGLGQYDMEDSFKNRMANYERAHDELKVLVLTNPDQQEFRQVLENTYLEWENAVKDEIENGEEQDKPKARLKLVDVYTDMAEYYQSCGNMQQRDKFLNEAKTRMDELADLDDSNARQILKALGESESAIRKYLESSKEQAEIRDKLNNGIEAKTTAPDPGPKTKDAEPTDKGPGEPSSNSN